MMIPTDHIHRFIPCMPIHKKGDVLEDKILDSWVDWFDLKGVPYRIVCRPDGRRELFKHQTRVGSDKFNICCEDFNENAEGRDLEYDASFLGYGDGIGRNER